MLHVSVLYPYMLHILVVIWLFIFHYLKKVHELGDVSIVVFLKTTFTDPVDR